MHRLYSLLFLVLLLCAAPFGALADGTSGSAGSASGTAAGSTAAPAAGYAGAVAQPSAGYGFGLSSGAAQPATGFGQGAGSFGTQPSGLAVAPGSALPTTAPGYQPTSALPSTGAPAPLLPPGTLVPGMSGYSPSSVPQGLLQGQSNGSPGAQPAGAAGAPGGQPLCDPTKENCAGKPTALLAGQSDPSVEVSSIEKSLSEEQLGYDKSQPKAFQITKLTQFGYGFFRPDVVGFAAQTDVPVGPDYVIGVGDRLILTLWGSVEGSYELEVNRNGEIVLPKIGSVKVLGTSYGQLPNLIRANLSRVIKDYHLTVNMGKLRMMKVYLVGEVKVPGDYTISSLSTLLNALSAAGGPTKNGSLRNIQVKRGGTLVDTVDLYDFFLNGDKSRDIRLQPGDTILVPVIGPVVGIAGNVRRPAIYELKNEKTLRDIMGLCDGINPSGYLQRIQIQRVQAHVKKIVSDFNLDPKLAGKPFDELTGAIKVQDMDLVKIFPIDAALRGYVRLTGYLLRTGDYALVPGARVSSILLKDYMLPEYYAEAGEITRLFPPDYHPEKIYFNVGKALQGDPAQDLELKEFDTVKIFSRWEKEQMPRVRIGGEIQQPGEYRLLDNMTVRDLVIDAGNPKLTAYLKNAEISRIRKSGEMVSSYSIYVNLGNALKGDPKDNIALAPFDEVTIRKIPNWSEETDRYITLKGEFVFPGVYPIYKGEKLSALIERAGGFTDKAYLKAARFTRRSVQDEQQKRMDELIAKTEQDITKKQSEVASVAASSEELAATKASLDGLMRSAEMLKSKRAEGRMVMQIAGLDTFRGGPYDIELMGGDTLYVPSTPNSVNVMGQVYNATAFIKVPGADVSYYLKRAGGPTRDAETDDMYVVRADGSVESRQNFQSFLFFNNFGSAELDSGDTLIVPQRLEKTAWMRDIKDIATILGQIALTAGVLIAAGL
jgi:polysaccharide biosynthesis/export protein